MKNKMILLFSIVVLNAIFLSSCDKSYTTGGIQDVNAVSQKTSYDFLKSNPAFDTLIQCIDAAGMKDAINANGNTYFAVTDYALLNYMGKRTVEAQKVDQYAKWGLDSLLSAITNNYGGVRDSLHMYLFAEKLTYNVLTNDGKYYSNGLPGDQVIISYEETRDKNLGYNPNYSSIPRVLMFAHVYPGNTYALSKKNPSSEMPQDVGGRTICSSSGITTSNGIVHVLSPFHSLFFNQY